VARAIRRRQDGFDAVFMGVQLPEIDGSGGCGVAVSENAERFLSNGRSVNLASPHPANEECFIRRAEHGG